MTSSDQNIYAKEPENRKDKTRKQQIALNDYAQLWPTPAARDHWDGRCGKETAERNARPLNEFAVTLWSIPRASDAEKGGPNQSFGAGGTPLPSQAAHFPSFHPDPPTLTDGEMCLASIPNSPPLSASHPGPSLPDASDTSKPEPKRTGLSLNPTFVEFLMGWPIGWTDFAVSETEWSRYRQRMRGALSNLLSANEPKGPVQQSLF